VQILRLCGPDRKAFIEPRHEFGKKSIAGFYDGDVGQPQLLDEPVL
jgi:hypothetical protein